MNEQSASEAKQEYIALLGAPLGTQYAELWQEIAELHLTWHEYIELFGTKKSRVDLLNSAAPQFFGMIQDRLRETVFLHIARLTDPPFSTGNKEKTNLTLLNLPRLIDDLKVRDEVQKRCDEASVATAFARDWRNRHIAHRDLDLALGQNATSLPDVQIREVNDALRCCEAVLNAIAGYFLIPRTSFHHPIGRGGTIELLRVIDDGLTAQREREARIAAGDYSKANFPIRDL